MNYWHGIWKIDRFLLFRIYIEILLGLSVQLLALGLLRCSINIVSTCLITLALA